MIVDLKQKVANNDVVIIGSEEHKDGDNEEEDLIDEATLTADSVYIRQIDYT
jgi:hypothetical protein